MTPVSIIETAMAAGIYLSACDGQIELVAKENPPADLLKLLRIHKAGVLDELERLQSLWLERVAYLLQSTPEYLLQKRFIDLVDLQQQWHKEPRHAANAIRGFYLPEQYQNNTGGVGDGR